MSSAPAVYAAAREEMVSMDIDYWLQFWWLFPIALGICVTV
jgi:hypothetical protein